MAGKKGKCPACGDVLDVPHGDAGAAPAQPGPMADAAAAPAAAAAGGDHKLCRFCGEQIKTIAQKCRFCGEYQDGSGGGRAVAPERSRASATAERRANEVANLSMILGIIAILVCPFIGIFSIMKGNEAKRLAAQARIDPPGGAMAGIVLGWISVALLILQVVVIFVMVGAMVAAGP